METVAQTKKEKKKQKKAKEGERKEKRRKKRKTELVENTDETVEAKSVKTELGKAKMGAPLTPGSIDFGREWPHLQLKMEPLTSKIDATKG